MKTSGMARQTLHPLLELSGLKWPLLDVAEPQHSPAGASRRGPVAAWKFTKWIIEKILGENKRKAC